MQPAGSDCVSEKASWVPEPLEKHTGELAVTNSKVPHREDGGVSVFTGYCRDCWRGEAPPFEVASSSNCSASEDSQSDS